MKAGWFFLAGSALAGALPAQAADDFCAVNGPEVENVAPLEGVPTYFTRVTPDGQEVGFIKDSNNYILNFADPSAIMKIPGSYDPVPSADGRYFLLPLGAQGMTFFPREAFDRQRKTGQTVDATNTDHAFQDVQLEQNYQSSGVVKEPGGGSALRVDTEGMVYADYTTSAGGKIARRGPVHKLCGNVTDQLRLPMLSKDGTMVAAYDFSSNTTKIYGISGDNCSEVLDLGLPTGKVDFDYSGKQLVFHVDSLDAGSAGQFITGVGPHEVKNIYIAALSRSADGKLQLGKIRGLTNNTRPGDGSYYPSFTKDGKVVYTQGHDGHYSIVKVDPSNLATRELLPGACAANGAAPDLAAAALGALWAEVCAKLPDGATDQDAALWSLGLTPQACQKLVEQKWPALKARVQAAALTSLDVSNLLAACPKGGAAPTTKPKVQPVVITQSWRPKSPRQIFSTRCAACHDTHSDAAPHIDWNDLSPTLVQEMLLRVQSDDPDVHMPPNTPLDQETEVDPLVDYLNRIQQSEGP